MSEQHVIGRSGEEPAAVSMTAGAPEKTVKLSPFASVRQRGRVYNMAKSAVRALDVIEHLAQAQTPQRAIDITRALALSPSSGHQILKTLMDSGYLIFDGASKQYHLSPRITRLGGALSQGYFGPGAIERLMRAVHEAAGGVVVLAASQGAFMQVLELVQPEEPAQRPPTASPEPKNDVGAQVPYFGTCTGAAWLSSQSDELVLGVMRRSRRDLGRQAREEGRTLESIRRVRRQGYAYGGLMAEDGVWSVAVPLPPAPNGVVLVLAVSAQNQAFEEKAAEIAAMIRSKIALCLAPAET
jgi:DNA-binding IclR family transcriptional regulator